MEDSDAEEGGAIESGEETIEKPNASSIPSAEIEMVGVCDRAAGEAGGNDRRDGGWTGII